MIKTTFSDSVTRFDLARTLAGRGRYWTTAYLVDGLLVDSGCAHTASALLSALEGRELSWIANTHTHEDHIGANGLLQRSRNGLQIRAHPLALPVLAAPRDLQPLHPYRRLFWGWPEPCEARALQDLEFIETKKFRFQVHFTPGHSPDHLCLYEVGQGWLFTGDLFVGGNDRALRAGYDIWQIIASLKRIADLSATRLFPGSARLRDDPQAALQAKINYLEDLGERVLALHKKGWPVGEITRQVCGGPMWVEFVTLGHFSRRHLVLSYLGENHDG